MMRGENFPPRSLIGGRNGHREITLNGKHITTLKELLRPDLKAVFVGLNPAQKSVERGHYYQGTQGRQFWNLLGSYDICSNLPRGSEDDAAFQQGFGFADLARRPTAKGTQVTKKEKCEGIDDLIDRLKSIPGRPLVIFRYKEPWKLSKERLERMGYRVLRMPSPGEPREAVRETMNNLRTTLRLAG